MIIAGFDIGGTKCGVSIAPEKFSGDTENYIIAKKTFSTTFCSSYRDVLAQLDYVLTGLIFENGFSKNELKSIGISCGGPLDNVAGVILSPPNLPGWDEVHICDHFSGLYRVPVKLENDANACALAEYKYGAARGSRNCIFLTCGTGMGAGIIIDGKLYTGANDGAGEVGHIRLTEDGPWGYGKHGSFEGWCSGGGIARLARAEALKLYDAGGTSALFFSFEDIGSIDARKVASCAADGDALALSIMTRSAQKLGQALSILIDILAPDVIVIGSVYARNREFYDSVIYPVIEREALPLCLRSCRIVPAMLGESVGDFAALSLASEFLDQ